MKPATFLVIASLSILGTVQPLSAQDGADAASGAEIQIPAPRKQKALSLKTIERGIEIKNGKSTEALWLVFGLERSYGRMPWGAELFVRPDLLIVGRAFPASGTVRIVAADPNSNGGNGPDEQRLSDVGPIAYRTGPLDTALLTVKGIWVQALALNLVWGQYELFRTSNPLFLPFATDKGPHDNKTPTSNGPHDKKVNDGPHAAKDNRGTR